MTRQETLATARRLRPFTRARQGSVWWFILDHQGVSWVEIPRGREPFAELTFCAGEKVSADDLCDDSALAGAIEDLHAQLEAS